MGKFILKRLLWLIPVVLGVTFFVFTIMHFTRGDPVRLMLGANATEETIEATREELGLNDPFLVQFARYCKNVFLHFDFGQSYQTKQSVTDTIFQRFPYTLEVAIISVIMAAVIGIPLGILAATKQYSWVDNLSMFAL